MAETLENGASENEEQQLTALEIAERMRRSFLASAAADTAYPAATREEYFKILDANKPMLLHLAKRLGVQDEQIEEFLRQGREFINALPHRSDFDDPGLLWTLQTYLDEIALTCTDLSLPIQDGVAIGTTPLAEINAHQMRAFGGSASFVEVTITLMRLCDFIAKALANTIGYTSIEGKVHCHINLGEVTKRLETETWLIDEWRRIIKMFATYGNPPGGDVGPEVRGPEAKQTRINMTEAMELWVIAHEVCHHILKHGNDESTAKDMGPFQEEHQADILSRYILAFIAKRRKTMENDFLVAGIGPALAHLRGPE